MPVNRIQLLEIENARLKAAAASEALRIEAYLRATSHDLRNSLSSVLTGSEVLLALNTSPALAPLLQSIQRQASVIAQIANRMMVDYEPSDLSQVQAADEAFPTTKMDSNKVACEGKPLRILAIDDRRDVLLTLRVLLTNAGHEFAEATDALSGLEKVSTFKPHIVLCDINLTGSLSGLEVARNIRLQSTAGEIYLVAISGNVQAEDLRKSARAGFDYHLAKPITAMALRNVICNRPKFQVEA
ncbi:MAG: response regulator [Pirellulaceae bacterium]|nr:response regulator [Pirellulaceae bacterium]